MRTILRPGKLAQVIGKMKSKWKMENGKSKLECAGLVERRWRENSLASEDNGVRIIHIGREKSQNGVSILIEHAEDCQVYNSASGYIDNTNIHVHANNDS